MRSKPLFIVALGCLVLGTTLGVFLAKSSARERGAADKPLISAPTSTTVQAKASERTTRLSREEAILIAQEDILTIAANLKKQGKSDAEIAAEVEWYRGTLVRRGYSPELMDYDVARQAVLEKYRAQWRTARDAAGQKLVLIFAERAGIGEEELAATPEARLAADEATLVSALSALRDGSKVPSLLAPYQARRLSPTAVEAIAAAAPTFEEAVLTQVVEFLGDYANQKASARLMARLAPSSAETVLHAAVTHLGRGMQDETRDALLTILGRDDLSSALRAAAGGKVARWMARQDVDQALRKVLEAKDHPVKERLLQQLAGMSLLTASGELVAAIVACLLDPDDTVALPAAGSLRSVAGRREVAEALLAQAQDKGRSMKGRVAALEALSPVSVGLDEAALKALQRLTQDEQEAVRQASSELLRKVQAVLNPSLPPKVSRGELLQASKAMLRDLQSQRQRLARSNDPRAKERLAQLDVRIQNAEAAIRSLESGK